MGHEERYRRYLALCNARRFDELGEFVAEPVRVNGERQSVQRYAAGLASVVGLFPDFHWDLQQLLADGPWMAARLVDTGTSPSGRSVRLNELALYRWEDDRIVEVWGDLDRDRLL